MECTSRGLLVTRVYLIRKAHRSFAIGVRDDSMGMCETWAVADIQYAELVPPFEA